MMAKGWIQSEVSHVWAKAEVRIIWKKKVEPDFSNQFPQMQGQIRRESEASKLPVIKDQKVKLDSFINI